MRTKQEILDIIEEEDVEFIRLQFTDVLGNLKNIAITPRQMEKVIDDFYPFEAEALYGNLYDPKEDLYLKPDLDTFVILPWRPQQGKVGKIICDVCDKDGNFFAQSPRTILKKVLEEAKQEGYTFMVDPECEFFLFHTDDNGIPTTITHEKAGYLDVGPIDLGENARRDMVLTLEDMGFEIESSHHEKAPAQHEIDFSQGEAMEIADSLMTFKFAVRSIAKRFGLYATFMPKPRTGIAGSGLHFNISMYKHGLNLFEGEKGEPSLTAMHFMGGIMEHAQAMCAITNPIVNSYKRLLPGFDAPTSVNWSKRGEKTLLKFHSSYEEAKVELRFPDPAANPYLALAVCISAGLEGVRKGIEPGEANASDCRRLPENLKDATRLLVEDELMQTVLGEKLVHAYSEIKNQEWDDYMLQVSDWEIEKYLVRM